MAKTYDLISATTITSATTDIDFSSIPATYTDLVLRIHGGSESVEAFPQFRFNSDTGSNYSSCAIVSATSGSTAGTNYYTQTYTSTSWLFNHDGSWAGANTNNFIILEIFNYQDTNKWRSVAAVNSGSSTTAGYKGAYNAIGTWMNTSSAINSVTCRLTNSGTLRNWSVGTTARLYGIKRA